MFSTSLPLILRINSYILYLINTIAFIRNHTLGY